MTPILHPLVVRFKKKRKGWKKDYYIVVDPLLSVKDLRCGLIKEDGHLVYVHWADVEIVNAEDFSFKEKDLI